MRAAITGATGLVGSNLAIALLSQGHRVRATRRASSSIRHLSEFDIEWVEASLGEPAALEEAFRGADVVFHCAALVGIQRKVSPALTATNVDGTRNVLNAVRGAGGPRLVYCSTVGAIGLSEDGKPCTEESRWNFDEKGMADGYVITKHRSQQLVLEAAADGLDVVTVNPTFMLGPYDPRPSSGRMIIDVVKGRVPGWTPGCNNFVDVRDVAKGMLLAWEKGRAGEKYILGGENMPYREIFEKIASIAGVEPPRREIPRWLAAPLGRLGDLQEWITGREPLINSVSIGYGFCTTFQFSSDKARAELGYAPGPIETAIRDGLAWFKAQGML